MKLKWDGRETSVYTKPVDELLELIPHFNRVPYKLHNGGTNKYLNNVAQSSIPSPFLNASSDTVCSVYLLLACALLEEHE